MSAESRRKMSEAAKRRPSNRLGLRHSEHTRQLISLRTTERTKRGREHYAWKGGVTPEQKRDRKGPRYAAWRLAVFERDGFRCQGCQEPRHGRLRAHHVKSFAAHPELRFDVDNGITTCDDCHAEVHAA